MITLDATDATLRHGLDRVFPRANHLDYEAAHQFADWLQEQGDWRWHLLATVCRRSKIRGTPAWRFSRSRRNYAGRELGCIADSSVLVRFGDGDCTVPVPPYSGTGTAIGLRVGGHELWSWLTPEQYAAMRADAATAGVIFPERPQEP